jgi:hypothetical protein
MNLRTGIAAATVAFALAPAASLAVDGVILIDQNKALAGNVTAGDAPGFPVSINAPGSYRLSGNLTVPAGVDGIIVASPGITLDLNGFSISSAGGFARGINNQGSPQPRTTVRNGQIVGFTTGIRLGDSDGAVVEDVHTIMQGIGGVAVVVGAYSRVQRNVTAGVGNYSATCPSILSENVTDGTIAVTITDPAKQCVRYHNRARNYGALIDE